MKLFVSSDNNLWVLGVKDPVAGTYFNSATISVVIYNPDGTTLATISSWTNIAGPKTINGVTYADGIYEGALAANVALVAQTQYDYRGTVTVAGKTAVFDGIVAAEYASLSGT